MTNKIVKLYHNGEEYLIKEWKTPKRELKADFRGKTVQQLSSEGWTVGYKGGYLLDSHGISNDNGANRSGWVTYHLPTPITENNIITIKMTGYGTSTASYAGGIHVGLSNGTEIDAANPPSKLSIHSPTGSSIWNSRQLVRNVGATEYYLISGTSSYGSGNHTVEATINMKTGLVEYKKTLPSVFNGTYTLTQAEREWLTGFEYVFGCGTTFASGGYYNYVGTLDITIE